MILQCFGELNSSMMYSCKLVLMEMYSRSYFFERINQVLVSVGAGVFQRRFISTVTNVVCHHPTLTHGYLMTVPHKRFLSLL